MTSSSCHFEAVIEAQLLQNGCALVTSEGFDRDSRHLAGDGARLHPRDQPKEWARLGALYGDKTGEQILGNLCKRMDQNASLATLHRGERPGHTRHPARR